MDFKVWLIETETQGEQYRNVKTAILTTLPDELKGTEKDENQILSMHTTDLGRDIIEKISSLGVLTSLKNDNPQHWRNIMDAIRNGITISELIDRIAGTGDTGVSDPAPMLTSPNIAPADTTSNQIQPVAGGMQ